MTTLDVTTSDRAGGAHVALSGELDIATAPNLRGLEFMDSSGLRALLAADARARERGARIVIVRGDERIQRVLKITRLDERLEIVDDVETTAGAA